MEKYAGDWYLTGQNENVNQIRAKAKKIEIPKTICSFYQNSALSFGLAM